MVYVLVHVRPGVALADTVEGAEGVEVAADRVRMEGNKDDVLHGRGYNL